MIESVLPDIVLLDVMMPKLNGFALCTELRRHPKFVHLPVMMITGLEDVQSIDRAFEVGATHFLTKPINWALLSHHVRYALRNSQLEDELFQSDQALRARIADLEKARNELERQRRNLLLLTEQLRTATDQANAANQAKSEFLAAISHELRTPLNAIIGFSEVMQSEALGPIGSPKYQELARDILASGQHLLDLINDILDLSKIQSGKAMLCEDDIEIPEVIRSVLTIVKEGVDEKNVKLDIECPDELPKLHADRRKLKQILISLLANAIKFTETGGKIMIRTWCEAASGHVFQIIDNGIGIAPKDIPKTLAKFDQVDSDLKPRCSSTFTVAALICKAKSESGLRSPFDSQRTEWSRRYRLLNNRRACKLTIRGNRVRIEVSRSYIWTSSWICWRSYAPRPCPGDLHRCFCDLLSVSILE